MAERKKDEHPRHDALFKSVFGGPRHAAAFLKSKLPRELVEQIDFSTLEQAPGSFVDTKLSQFHTDVLFTVRVAGEDGLLYVLLEHQSSDHPLMAFRVLEYTVKVWRAWLKAHPRRRRLPPLIPVVLYHGPRGWKAKTSVHDLVSWPRGLRDVLSAYVPNQRYLLEDLTRLERTAFQDLPLTELGRLALFMLQHSRAGDDAILTGLREMHGLLDIALRDDPGAALALVRYIFTAVDERDRFLEEMAPELGAPAQEAMMSVAEQLQAEGHAKGKLEGKLEGMAGLLARQLTLKFGPLPEIAQLKLAGASADELSRWGDRVLTAETLDAIFAG